VEFRYTMKMINSLVQLIFLLTFLLLIPVVVLADEPGLWDKATSAANKGLDVAKESAEDAAEWASDAATKAAKATKKQSKKAWKETSKATKKGSKKAADWLEEKAE